MYHKIIFYGKLLKKSIISFVSDDILTHAASISYYMVFSLPSMLIIVLWSAAQFYKEAEVHEAIFQKMTVLLGEPVSEQVMLTIQKLSLQEPTWFATIVGIVMILFFATTVFDAMRTALNKIAQVESSDSVRKNIWLVLRVRFIAISLLVSISFFLLISLTLDIILSSVSQYLSTLIGEWAEYLFVFNPFLLDYIPTTLIFALYFRYLPDVRLKWSDAFWGALWTAGLFTAGKGLIGMFIGNNQVVDLYDAAGSLLVLMLWVYYASIIFLFGAIFTFHRAREKSSHHGYDKYS